MKISCSHRFIEYYYTFFLLIPAINELRDEACDYFSLKTLGIDVDVDTQRAYR
jgi:hypothetical protein